jgi:hypothetical protein
VQASAPARDDDQRFAPMQRLLELEQSAVYIRLGLERDLSFLR